MIEIDKPCKISIRNSGGVPIVEIVGELNKAALKAVESTISTLASAGHYHIVLNIQRAVAANVQIAETLRGAAKDVLKHYGAIDIVAEAAQISQLLSRSKIGRTFRFCTTENEALRRIKKLTRPPETCEPQCSARIMEAK